MKYLLVLLVVGLGLWMWVSRLRGGDATRRDGGTPGPGRQADAGPVVMVQCAHCGLHLASVDALPEGSRLYCGDAHRRLGPGPQP